MAEHHELVAEMSLLEHMGTQERQKLAKKRRLQQLKKWGQREKEWIAKEKQLNKRLASMLNEENNGLNLKQYTTYSSSHRSKKKLQITSATTNVTNNNNNILSNGAKNTRNDFLNNNNISTTTDPQNQTTRFRASTNGTVDVSLTPSGRVHFNIGVMLLEAAARNDFDEVKRLLMLGVSPDSINHDGLTALHQCCIDASEPMMNLLLEFGANVDARDTEQWTPLHAACTCGHLNLVKILVENGADLLAVNGDGNMPFDICEDEATLDYIESQMVERGITQEMIDFTRASTEMQMISDLEKLVADGEDLNVANEQGVTFLHVAAANGYLSAVKFLIKHGVNVNVCDNDQWRPLHGAACWGNEQHIKVIEHLVEAGAVLDAKTINDETAFDLCDNVELLERLNQLKDELESKQASGGDRLKRTQSKTNSRVHSVRRTSVRDKNQISRREAREEALLRVDSQPIEPKVAPGLSNGKLPTSDSIAKQQPETNGVTNKPIVSTDLDKLSAVETPSFDLVDGSSNKRTVQDCEMPVPHEQTNSEGKSQSRAANVSTEPIGGPSSLAASNEPPSIKQANGTSSRSQTSSTHDSNDLITNKRKQLSKQSQVVSCDSPKIDDCSNNSLTTYDASTTIGPKAVQTVKLQVSSTHNNPTTALTSTTTTTSTSLGRTKTYINGNNSSNSSSSVRDKNSELHDTTTTACDQNHNHQQSSASMVPINYTLSNLKKQRSDLRMRSTSIGGNNSSSSVAASSVSQVVVLDPQPNSLPTGNGLHRPESPSSTFRKFRGDPSEMIGGADRSQRHKCCILI